MVIDEGRSFSLSPDHFFVPTTLTPGVSTISTDAVIVPFMETFPSPSTVNEMSSAFTYPSGTSAS